MNIHQVAEINVARMRGVNINDPVMREFVDNLDSVNALAEQSEGFIWRLKDDSNNATNLNPYNDEQVIINISVWASIKALEDFVYRTHHTEFLRRRKDWFQAFGKQYVALWWIPEGQVPTIENAIARLDHLQKNGPSAFAFDFRKKFGKPE